jgi:hypothetical protein
MFTEGAKLLSSGLLIFYELLSTSIWALAMTIQSKRVRPRQSFKRQCLQLTGDAVLDVQFAFNTECFREAVERGMPESLLENIRVLRLNTYMDFFFIPLYTATFALLAWLDPNFLTKWALLLILITALFDVLENYQILKSLAALLNNADQLSALPRRFSRPKWAAFACALLLLACIAGGLRLGFLLSSL